MGYSETAFVEAQGGRGQYRVRYFSPQAEVAFCGHATIAAAVAIADRGGSGFLRFSTLAGPIPVQTSVTSDWVDRDARRRRPTGAVVASEFHAVTLAPSRAASESLAELATGRLPA